MLPASLTTVLLLAAHEASREGVHLYLRADLDRVLAGPFRGPRGTYPDFDRLPALIVAATV